MQISPTKMISVGVLFVLLLCIRIFEQQLFYDPFILFFKNEFIISDQPDVEFWRHIMSVSLRYFLNAMLSIGVLYVAFKQQNVVKFSIIFYGLMFVVLIMLYAFFVSNLKQELHTYFFYVRRFTIQPVFLLLLLPAFYYQNLLRKNQG